MTFTAGVVLAVLAAGPQEGLTGKEVLDRVRRTTTALDRKASAVMTVTDRNGRVQSRTMRLVMKGDSRMMMTFASPADLAGVTFMTTSSENMWIYLPSQGRTRRISGSMANQGFGGSDFSYKEMANVSFAGASKVTAMKETSSVELGGAVYRLELVDGEGEKSRLWVEKGRFLPRALEKFGADGKTAKTVSFGEYAEHDGTWIPHKVEMKDLKRGSRTELTLSRLEMNTGIRDNFFTEANMKRGAM